MLEKHDLHGKDMQIKPRLNWEQIDTDRRYINIENSVCQACFYLISINFYNEMVIDKPLGFIISRHHLRKDAIC